MISVQCHRERLFQIHVHKKILVICLSIVLIACGKTDSSLNFATQNLTIRSGGNMLGLTVEVADTDAKRRQGLMNRVKLDQENGMLFVFDSPGKHSFWMKDTFISLDIFFISENKEIVYIAENTTPFSEEPIAPDENVSYVLEVNAGYAASHGIRPGDRVE